MALTYAQFEALTSKLAIAAGSASFLATYDSSKRPINGGYMNQVGAEMEKALDEVRAALHEHMRGM